MSEGKLYSVALVVGVALAIGLGMSRTPDTSTWEGLIDPDGREIVLLLKPANCAIEGGEIKRLNGFASTSAIPIRIVFVAPPAKEDQAHVLRLFQFLAPVDFDDDGAWARAAMRAGLPTQTALLVDRGRVLRSAPADDWESIMPGIAR